MPNKRAPYTHRRADVPNFNRSHIWWAMAEAKKRAPDVTFYGLAGSFPGYLGTFYSREVADFLVHTRLCTPPWRFTGKGNT